MGIVVKGLKVAIATIFVYLSLKDGIKDGNIIYTLLFGLLAIEYIVDLLEYRKRDTKG